MILVQLYVVQCTKDLCVYINKRMSEKKNQYSKRKMKHLVEFFACHRTHKYTTTYNCKEKNTYILIEEEFTVQN